MENASKALLMTGGILLAIILLCAVVLNYNKMVEFYNKDKNMTEAEQIAKFNNQYTQYNRDNIRGSDLLSLVNKIVDNNKRNGEEKITIEITINNLTDFTFDGGAGSYTKMQPQLMNGNKIKTEKAHILSAFVTTIENNSGLNEKELQLLTKNISNLFLDEANATKLQKVKREDIIKEIYNINTDLNNTDIAKAQKAALEYYQIQQFKRARFDCESVDYDDITGKINYFSFNFTGNFN